MDYFTYCRFRGQGIGGQFNLPYGTHVALRDKFLYTSDGQCICAATSENGWEHFYPDTPEGHYRQRLLNKLYKYYESHDDFPQIDSDGLQNTYWKNILRTAQTDKLTEWYMSKFGELPKED